MPGGHVGRTGRGPTSLGSRSSSSVEAPTSPETCVIGDSLRSGRAAHPSTKRIPTSIRGLIIQLLTVGLFLCNCPRRVLNVPPFLKLFGRKNFVDVSRSGNVGIGH
jgi:hypothetical protein